MFIHCSLLQPFKCFILCVLCLMVVLHVFRGGCNSLTGIVDRYCVRSTGNKLPG